MTNKKYLNEFIEFLISKMPVVDSSGEKYFQYLTEKDIKALATRFETEQLVIKASKSVKPEWCDNARLCYDCNKARECAMKYLEKADKNNGHI